MSSWSSGRSAAIARRSSRSLRAASIGATPWPTESFAGTAQDAWSETYQAAQVGDFPAGCYIGAASASEDARIGTERGLLFNLACLPGWMLLTAYGDRGYDLRLTSANAADPGHGKQLFLAILASFSFDVPAP